MSLSIEDAIVMITDEFPELGSCMEDEKDFPYMQMGYFAIFTQEAIDSEDRAKFKRICEVVRQMLLNMSPELRNPLHVSYLEHLCFEDSKRNKRQWAYSKMPTIMQKAYEDIMGYLERLHSPR